MVKSITIYIVLTQGFLSWNPTLYVVGARRQWEDSARPIEHSIKLSDYECAVGMPYGYQHLIGKEVYFRDMSGNVFGPWIVTDVEQRNHHPYMSNNNLAADVSCYYPTYDKFVHKQGEIIAKLNHIETRY